MKIVQDHTALEMHKDSNICVACGVNNNIEVKPDLPKNKWKCTNCGTSNLWKPSKEYLKINEGKAEPLKKTPATQLRLIN